jgi:hypothetical protein
MTSNPLVSKLEHGATLRDEDRARLEKLCEPMVEVSARKSIIDEGDEPDDVHLVMQGLGLPLQPAGEWQSIYNGVAVSRRLLQPACRYPRSDGSRDRNLGAVSHCENSPNNDRGLDEQSPDPASAMVGDSG